MCLPDLDKRTLDELAYCNSRFRELTKHIEELRHERNLLNERIMEKEREVTLFQRRLIGIHDKVLDVLNNREKDTLNDIS